MLFHISTGSFLPLPFALIYNIFSSQCAGLCCSEGMCGTHPWIFSRRKGSGSSTRLTCNTQKHTHSQHYAALIYQKDLFFYIGTKNCGVNLRFHVIKKQEPSQCYLYITCYLLKKTEIKLKIGQINLCLWSHCRGW